MSTMSVYLWFLFLLFLSNVDAIIQDYYWRYYIPGDIPYDAIEVSAGKYIGLINFLGHDKACTIYSYDKVAVAQGYEKTIVKENIKILAAPDPSRFYWEYVDFEKSIDRQMKDAVKGGYQIHHKTDMFIGKVYHEDEWKVSNVLSITHADKGLWVWDKVNKVAVIQKFYILKYNYTIGTSDAFPVCDK